MRDDYRKTSNISQSQYQLITQSLQSPTIYEAWVKCVTLVCSQPLPILEKQVAGKDITITMHWIRNNTNDEQTITDVSYGNLSPSENGHLLQKNQRVKERNSYQMKFRIVKSDEQAYVTITMSNYPPTSIAILPIPKVVPASDIPIGTIVASVLDWGRFCNVNGQSENLTNYGDKQKCKWVPADGRSVIGSSYGATENKVPDLRGVFLRGLNDFGVKGVQDVATGQADLNDDGTLNNRKANNLEQDRIISHTHSIPVPATGATFPGNALEAVGRSGSLNLSSSTVTPINFQPVGAETRPKNVSIYYYIKIN